MANLLHCTAHADLVRLWGARASWRRRTVPCVSEAIRVESSRVDAIGADSCARAEGIAGGQRRQQVVWPATIQRGRVSASLEPPNASEKQLLQLTLSRRLSPQRSAAHRPSRRALTYQHRRAGGRVANPIANTRHVFAGRIAGKQLVLARAHLPHSRRISICTVQ